ncbi:helix-turn-helix domain-containing protein [Acidobacteria bacterium AB60]|nr:helix-turn-helix domain-containing protein [Acidobacteria bacterium AB60]
MPELIAASSNFNVEFPPMATHDPNRPAAAEWSERILRLIEELKLTQAGLAERLGVSPATVSRWIQGKIEPTAEGYVSLGNLAPRSEGVYFWERAGIDVSGFPDASLGKAATSLQVSLQDFAVVGSRRASQQLDGHRKAVAIPLLNVSAYGDRVPPDENVSLAAAEVEEVLLAPLDWCPNPEGMISMHLVGDSMSPAIAPGSILFVDTEETDRDKLNQKIVVMAHRDLGFKVARLQRLPSTDLLISSNSNYLPLDVSNASRWKVFGEVLWWVSRDLKFGSRS